MTDELMKAVARGWCSPENSHKEMDPDLAAAIAREVDVATRTDLADALAAAAKAALNFIENTEGELGITLGSGDKLRTALAAYEGRK